MAKKSRHRRGLPAEIEREILIRLPVKTLRRFQSTCKSWYSLISSPQFQRDHQFFHSRNNPLLLTVREDDDDPFTLQFFSYTNSKEETLVNTFSKKVPYICNDGILPIQSCQGLLCLACSFSTIPSILICNPSTEELIVLPQSQRLSHCFGFGYAASTEEFKVVNFANDQIDIINFCKVFTLGSAHWRESRSPPYFSSGAAPFLHGALHLPPDPWEKDKDYIAAFDLETEEYKCIPLPTCYRSTVERYDAFGELEYIRFTVLRGSLCITFAFGPLLEFLILKDYNNAEWQKGYTIDTSPLWEKEYTIDMACDIGVPSGDYFPIEAIGIMGDEIVLLGYSGIKVADLWCYDPQDGIFTQKFDDVLAAAFYEESFFSLGTRELVRSTVIPE